MRARIIAVTVCLVLIASFVSLAVAQETKEVKHEYIGAKKCMMCHKKSGIADSWAATKHATAWDNLTAEQKKDKALIPFYTTGTDAAGELLTGIQCEACHGPGSDYKSMSIMKDKEKAIANGLQMPDEKTCLKCHNDKAPTAALAATAKDFNFAKMVAKGVHVMPTKEAKTEEKK